jgi:hypothetical protein
MIAKAGLAMVAGGGRYGRALAAVTAVALAAATAVFLAVAGVNGL